MPSASQAGRTRNSGEAVMTTSSSRWAWRNQGVTRGRFSRQKAATAASTSSIRRRKPNMRCLNACLGFSFSTKSKPFTAWAGMSAHMRGQWARQ